MTPKLVMVYGQVPSSSSLELNVTRRAAAGRNLDPAFALEVCRPHRLQSWKADSVDRIEIPTRMFVKSRDSYK
jgi:hypothetical protein